MGVETEVEADRKRGTRTDRCLREEYSCSQYHLVPRYDEVLLE